MPGIKEPDYFGSTYGRGAAWYASLFKDARPGQIRGEASTNYSCGSAECDVDTCIERIGKTLPDAKLIYIMRHPVQRAYAFYVEQIRTMQRLGQRVGFEQTFETYMKEDARCVESSRYIDIIRKYRRYFSAESMLLLTLDELSQDESGTMGKVFAFLGVDGIPAVEVRIAANRSADHNEAYLREHVIAPLRRIPVIGALGAKLGRPMRDRIYRILRATRRAKQLRQELICPPMLPGTRARLLEELRGPTEELAAYLGKDLSGWMK